MSLDRINPKQASTAQRVRLADLARLAGVSVATVSRSLQDSPLINRVTKTRVRQLAADQGYFLEDNPQAHADRVTVAVMLPAGDDAGVRDLMPGLIAAARDARCNLLLSPLAAGAARDLPEALSRIRADAFIFFDQRELRSALKTLAADGAVRFMVWGGGEGGYARLAPDHFGAGHSATRYLIGQGCRRIAYAGDCEGAGMAERFMGYLTALNEAGLPVDQALVAGGLDAVPAGCDGVFVAGRAPRQRPAHLSEAAMVVCGAARPDLGAAGLDFDGDLAGRRLLAALLCRRDTRPAVEKVPFDLSFV